MLSEQRRRSCEKPAQVHLSLLSASEDAADERKRDPRGERKIHWKLPLCET